MEGFVQAAKVGELAPGDMKLVQTDDASIALVNVDGNYYAIGDLWTHHVPIHTYG